MKVKDLKTDGTVYRLRTRHYLVDPGAYVLVLATTGWANRTWRVGTGATPFYSHDGARGIAVAVEQYCIVDGKTVTVWAPAVTYAQTILGTATEVDAMVAHHRAQAQANRDAAIVEASVRTARETANAEHGQHVRALAADAGVVVTTFSDRTGAASLSLDDLELVLNAVLAARNDFDGLGTRQDVAKALDALDERKHPDRGSWDQDKGEWVKAGAS